ncbi:MAG: hypothetical protein NUW06_07815 [Candidatus Acetothermia bacterium]|jgi:hypothetical protein|nr:hypothetical protein [Candidatus Acetothermia bacterium]MDH7505940.1 hypothetical protein [Candidatus Acetothermia bacterium]
MKRAIVGAILLSVFLVLPVFGEGIEELARQRIAAETGLDEELIATLFVSEETAQFILTFIYIDERVFSSRLKPELLEAIMPYRNREAMLVLVTPTRESYFNPFLLTFTQDWVSYRPVGGAVRRINESFAMGTIPQGEVAAGVILLEELEPELTPLEPEGLDVHKPFTISYSGYTTSFALRAEPAVGVGIGLELGDGLLQLLLFGLLQILLLLLLGFLV